MPKKKATVISAPRKMPARPIPALLFLAQPQSILVMINGSAAILAEKDVKYVNPQTLDALIEFGWVNGIPRAAMIGTLPVRVYDLTQEGKDRARRFEEDKSGYLQLKMSLQEENDNIVA